MGPKDIVVPKSSRSGAGTFFRIAYYNHLSLSQQADHKAHLMLGLNTLILSLVMAKHHIGVLSRISHFRLPNLLLIGVCVLVIILAVLAARPILPRNPERQLPNWLFFGSFFTYSYKVYEENINRLLRDEEALQEAMSRDLFFLGRALAKKYRYLAYCYSVAMVGYPSVAVMYLIVWLCHH